MASHPYISGAGNIAQMVGLLRKNFPTTVTSETVKKYSLASNNESYVINALQFIGVIDEEGKKTEKGRDTFVLDNENFPKAFEGLIRDSYKDLFDVRGDDAWSLSKKELTAYFRTTDKTSEAIGGRQAGVFQTFRALAGHEKPQEKSNGKTTHKPKPPKTKLKQTDQKTAEVQASQSELLKPTENSENRKDVSLTVRIEINLPANGSQETYDNIFKSIRANLINE